MVNSKYGSSFVERFAWYTHTHEYALQQRFTGESATTVAASTKLKVVLLLNIPRDKYTKAGLYIEATDEEYKKYMDYVESSKFIKTLKEQGIQVDVKAQLACKTLEEEEALVQQHDTHT